jgi:hypothetical protein
MLSFRPKKERECHVHMNITREHKADNSITTVHHMCSMFRFILVLVIVDLAVAFSIPKLAGLAFSSTSLFALNDVLVYKL